METKGISLTYFTFSLFVCFLCFLCFPFFFYECPSDINYKTEKKGRIAAGKS